jgi:hypothetical protein
MSVVLETELDRQRERRVMDKVAHNTGMTYSRFPSMSPIDFQTSRNGTITAFVDVKVRKESIAQVQQYGPLMLKHRKVAEFATVTANTGVPCLVLYAFDNGDGAIRVIDPATVTHLTPVAPPVRRNFRGLACDLEPVLMCDWNLVLHPTETVLVHAKEAA